MKTVYSTMSDPCQYIQCSAQKESVNRLTFGWQEFLNNIGSPSEEKCLRHLLELIILGLPILYVLGAG